MAHDRRLLVRVDLDALRLNVARADRQPITRAEVVQFLVDLGFRPTPRGWVVAEADLVALEPGEFTVVGDAEDDTAAL